MRRHARSQRQLKHLRISGPLATALVAVTVIVIILVVGISTARNVALLTTHSAQLRATIAEANRALRQQLEEESSIRGYVATGDPEFLGPYNVARRAMDGTFATLDAGLRRVGAAGLLTTAADLKSTHGAWEREVADRTIGVQDRARVDALQQHGRALVDRFRADVTAITSELELRSQLAFDATQAGIRTGATSALVLILVIAAVAIVFATYQNIMHTQAERRRRDEEVAREIAQQLRTIVRAIPQLLWIGDADGRATYFNDRWYQYTGQTEAAALGEGWRSALHPDDLDVALAATAASRATLAPYRVEYRLRGANGEYRWFVASAVPEIAEDGTLVRWIGTCTDVDDQRRAIDSLQRMADAMPQLVFITDGFGNTLYRNARWQEYTGRDPASSPAIDSGAHPDDRPEVGGAWARAIAAEAPFESIHRLRRADGSYRWFFVRAVPYRDSTGRVMRWFGTQTDIHDQHVQLESTQRIADAFQQAQLPHELPQSPNLTFDATYLAAEDVAQVGGDWYDVFALDDRRFIFSLGDVTGHGVEAAVVMSRVRQAIFALASLEHDPAAILEKANHVLRIQGDQTVTALCGLIDAPTGEIAYASAGHPPALIVDRAGQIRELTSGSPPLGVSERFTIAPQHDRLRTGEMLVCYTDGIVENDRDLLRGEQELRAVLTSLGDTDEPADEIRRRVLHGRRGRDDVAILTIRRVATKNVSRDIHAA
jgi:PAS domain S-box-containing protein